VVFLRCHGCAHRCIVFDESNLLSKRLPALVVVWLPDHYFYLRGTFDHLSLVRDIKPTKQSLQDHCINKPADTIS
jgi:hypothetical protein